jgi:hypothetical protein
MFSYELIESPAAGADNFRATTETKNVPAIYLGAKVGFTF